jgi:hypothetical protein
MRLVVGVALMLGVIAWGGTVAFAFMTLGVVTGRDAQAGTAATSNACDCQRFAVMNAACVVTSVARAPNGLSCSSYVNCSDFSSLLRVPCPLPSGSYGYPSSTCPDVGAVVPLWFRNGTASLTEPPSLHVTVKAADGGQFYATGAVITIFILAAVSAPTAVAALRYACSVDGNGRIVGF